MANGCESKLSQHGKQTQQDRWLAERRSSRVTDGRLGWCDSAKCPVGEAFQENSKAVRSGGRQEPVFL